MKVIILSVAQRFSACMVLSTGNFRVSGRIELLISSNQGFLFIYFFFSEVNGCVSIASFSKLSLGNNLLE